MRADEFIKSYADNAMKLSRYKDRIKQRADAMNNPYIPKGSDVYYTLKAHKTDAERTADECKAKLKAIEEAVEMVKTDKYKTLLYYRYIKYWSWERITDLLSEGRKERYSAKNVMGYMKHRALDELQKVLDSHPEIVI